MSKQSVANVVQEFQCKLSGQFYPVGSQYVAERDRIQFLTEQGYVEGATEVAPSSIPDDSQVKEVVESVTPNKRKDSSKDKPE